MRMRVRLPVRLVRAVELPEERALAVERLDDRHAGDRLGDLRGHDAIVSRTRRNAACDFTWNQRQKMNVGGRSRARRARAAS